MYDIDKLTCYNNTLITETKLSGNELLSLDKGSLERFQVSSGFQKPLLKVIDDLVYVTNVNARIVIILVLYHVEKAPAISNAVTTTTTKVTGSYFYCRHSAVTLFHYQTARY